MWRLEETPREGNIKTLSSTVSLISKTVPVTESVAHLWVVGQSNSPTDPLVSALLGLRL